MRVQRSGTAIIAISVLASLTSLAASQTVAGVTFWLPSDLVSKGAQPPPLLGAWGDSADTVTVSVMSIATADGNASAAGELEDWPAVGRSLVAGFADSQTKALRERFAVDCTSRGIPIERDLDRMAIHVEVRTTCATTPERFSVRSSVVYVLTRSEQIAISVASTPEADSQADAIAAGIWKTLQVEERRRILRAPRPIRTDVNPLRMDAVDVPGAVRFVDYGLTRPAFLVGQYIGALLVTVLLSALLVRLTTVARIAPLPALVGIQLLLIALRVWGEEQDGVWTLDPVRDITVATVTLAVLLRWARRLWARRYPGTPSPPRPALHT